jgi:uncharacterized coiled-coil protein SlyX
MVAKRTETRAELVAMVEAAEYEIPRMDKIIENLNLKIALQLEEIKTWQAAFRDLAQRVVNSRGSDSSY